MRRRIPHEPKPVAPAVPQLIAEMIEIAGPEAAWKLIGAHGGTRVHFPAKVNQGHWLARLVGLDEARNICQQFAGLDVVLPHARRYHSKMALVKALENGASTNEAARTAGMTQRSAFRARAQIKQRDPRQSSLFGDDTD